MFNRDRHFKMGTASREIIRLLPLWWFPRFKGPDVNSVMSQSHEVLRLVKKQLYGGPNSALDALYSQIYLRIYVATNGLGGSAQTDCRLARESLGAPLTGSCI